MTESTKKQLMPFSTVEYQEAPFNSDDIKVTKMTLDQPPKPNFRATFILVLITAGHGEIVINNQLYSLEKGSLLWLFPYHTFLIETIHIPLEYVVFETTLNVLMYSSITSTANEEFVSLFEYYDVPLVLTSLDQYNELDYLFTSSLQEYTQRDYHFELILLGNLYKIVTLFVRTRLSLMSPRTQTNNQAWFIFQYLHYHFVEDITIESLSQQLNLSSAEINTALQQLTGKNFHKNMTEIRMLNAQAMMGFDDLSIDYIAKFVGYKSTPSFTRQFKKNTGMTPGDFRHTIHDASCFNLQFKQNNAFDMLQYLFENYSENVTSYKLAQVFYRSESKINEQLFAAFGYNFTQLLTLVRMIFAKNLVVLTDKKIIEISSTVGYDSSRTFNRHFKSQWGTTPTTYRKQNRR